MRLKVWQYRGKQRRLEALLKAVSEPGNQPQLAAANMRRHMHAVHHRQQRVGGAMHHQRRHLQPVEQIHPAALGKNRQQLPLHTRRIEGSVVGHFSLMQEHRPIIHHRWATQRRQQIRLLLQRHLSVRRLAARQQL